jgi:predicted ATP-grasp superfamily ATP-dependent carboligase
MRMRLGLLQDPAVIDRQIKKEVQLAEAARQKAAMPTVKTEEEMKADEALTEKEREAIRKKAEERSKPRIRPLSEQKAIEMGANFAAETFIFAVGISVILFENWRQRRKAKNARDDIREDLEELQNELKTVKAELQDMKTRHPEPAPSSGLFGLWKGKVDESKSESRPTVSKPSSSASPTTHASAMEPTSKPPPFDEKDPEQQPSTDHMESHHE